MLQNSVKDAFVALGIFFAQFTSDTPKAQKDSKGNDLFYESFAKLIEYSKHHNQWFTSDNVRFALRTWSEVLSSKNIDAWLALYDTPVKKPKTVAIIMAGNIPLVGFHDFMCVLLSGHKVLIKSSSNDAQLIRFVVDYLQYITPELHSQIEFAEGKLDYFDAVIATGSNNTARYFEYYFQNKPSIIRKNRNSVALLTGRESLQELVALGKDIFTYFGLGCRSVSKILVPKDYDFKLFFEAMYTYKDVIFYEKYAHNYDYNKAVFLMSNYALLDNEFLILKEDAAYGSPIATLFYEYYESFDKAIQQITLDVDKLQCVVGHWPEAVPFGQTQHPQLSDYADNVDTMLFLTHL